MRRHVKGWSRPLAGILAVLMGVTLAASPAVAETASSSGPGVTKTSLAAAVARAADKAPRAALAQDTDTQSTTPDTTGGFLGSGKGKLAAVLFVAGTAWTIYTVSDARKPVKSPIR